MTGAGQPPIEQRTADPGTTVDQAADAIRRLERRLARYQAENHELERLIESKTRSLYLAQEELRSSKHHLENVLASMHSAVLITDRRGRITSVGGRTEELTGRSGEELIDQAVSSLLVLDIPPIDSTTISQLASEAHEGELAGPGDGRLPVLVAVSDLSDQSGTPTGAIFAATDISERKQLEVELRHAQRLESIGELAAGVAHEINTPIQYVSDGVRFIGESLRDLLELIASYEPLVGMATDVEGAGPTVAAVRASEAEIELPFLRDELPRAVDRTLDGVERVATIVPAMKQFSHPGSDELVPVDVNAIIDNTLTVARNEYKYVAEIDLELADLPDVMGDPGDLGQVFLNLLVNASHAIADHQEASGETTMGRITITTRAEDDAVVIDVADTGGGIPEAIRARVFEPFFTTKEPGRGSGQGLAIAHNQVVKKHGGRLDFDVVDGVGTTFHVWLPRKRNDRP